MSTRKCPACGAEFDGDIRFCTECGAPLPDPKPADPAPAAPKPFRLDPGIIEGAIPAEPDASAFPPVEPAPEAGFQLHPNETSPVPDPAQLKPGHPSAGVTYNPNYNPAYGPNEPAAAYPPPQPASPYAGPSPYAGTPATPGGYPSGSTGQDARQTGSATGAQPGTSAGGPSGYARPAYPPYPPYPDRSGKPASGWAFFGLFWLFAIPLVGWICAIVFACGGGLGKNRNLRSFSRAWLGLVVMLSILGTALLLAFGGLASSALDRAMEGLTAQSERLPGPGGSTLPAPSADGPLDAPAPAEEVPLVGGPFEGLPSERFASILAAGTYSLDFSFDLMGFSIAGRQAADGDRAMAELSMFGMQLDTLQIGSVSYLISDENQAYAITDSDSAPIQLPTPADYQNLTHLESRSEMVDGIQCDCDTFLDPSDTTLKIYTREGEIYGIGLIEPTLGMDILLRIRNFSATVPEGLLELPEGYREVSESELGELTGGFGLFG